MAKKNTTKRPGRGGDRAKTKRANPHFAPCEKRRQASAAEQTTDDLKRYLRTLFADVASSNCFVAVSYPTTTGKGLVAEFVELQDADSLDTLTDLIRQRSDDGHDVYVQPNLLGTRPQRGRGKACDVELVVGFYADIDVAKETSTKSYPSREHLDQVLERLPLRPTMVVETRPNGGLHAYWLLKKPIRISDEATRAELKETSRRWQNRIAHELGSDDDGRPFDLDPTFDLARVLRPAGTRQKSSDDRVRLLHPAVSNGGEQALHVKRHSLAAFKAEGRDARPGEKQRVVNAHGSSGLSPSNCSSLDRADRELLQKARDAENGSKFCTLWEGRWREVTHADGTRAYPSASEADFAMASMLGFWCGPDAEARIEKLMRASGLAREKWDTNESYLANTIGNAIRGCDEFYRRIPDDEESAQEPEERPMETSRRKKQRAKRKPQPKSRQRRSKTNDKPRPLTDTGNAERLVQRFGSRLRYCWPWDKWLVWDGRRWAMDQTGEVDHLAKRTARSILKEAVNAPSDRDRDLLVNFARRSEGASQRAAMVRLAKSERGIAIMPDELDTNPFLLNVANGTINLKTGQIRPHAKENLITKLASVAYDPDAQCPRFERFLREIFDGDSATIEFVQKFLGHCLTGDVSEQILPIFYGVGQNGKSTLLEAFFSVVGNDYSMKAPADLLLAKHGNEHPTALTDLHGKRFVACIETDDNRRLAESLTKELTGGDQIRARRMREDYWQFVPTHKIVLACNHKPAVHGQDFAIWRRIKLVPFDVVIPPEQRDKNLPKKLIAERPGILAWLVDGCRKWQQSGLGEPSTVIEATRNYASEEDVIGQFVDECCIVRDDCRIKAAALLPAYQEWSGERHTTVRQLSKRLENWGLEKYTNNGTWFRGIQLSRSSCS